ncbi:heavy metal-associated domain-containing protein [Deinococcus frigens]|nr:heavy metal-associated domain-containing protein [Deinococcus frigens]
MTGKTVGLDIARMTCAACVGWIERGLQKADGVRTPP